MRPLPVSSPISDAAWALMPMAAWASFLDGGSAQNLEGRMKGAAVRAEVVRKRRRETVGCIRARSVDNMTDTGSRKSRRLFSAFHGGGRRWFADAAGFLPAA